MDRTQEIVELAAQLIRIPSVTVGNTVRLEEVHRAADFIGQWLTAFGVPVRRFDHGDYPALLAGFPDGLDAPVMLSGHFDVVAPEPDDSQFEPAIEGDYLLGRGAADMKTVVATYMVWLKDTFLKGPPYPRVNLLLVGNEETGELEPVGTGHVLEILKEEGYRPDILIAGERTEESGTRLWGQVCIENRGIARFRIICHGARSHSGMTPQAADLTQKIIRARTYLSALAEKYLTLHDSGPWHSQIRFPFVRVGTPGVYNITPDFGELGVEIRAIPGDPLDGMLAEFDAYAHAEALEITEKLVEPGSACQVTNRYLGHLLDAVAEASGADAVLGKKMAGTSARFAPGGNGVVWGQSGIGPHSADERHYIPSIDPYYRALVKLGANTLAGD